QASERDGGVPSVLNPTRTHAKPPRPPPENQRKREERAETPKGRAAWNPRNFLFTTPPPAAAPAAAAAAASAQLLSAQRRLGDGAKGRRHIKMQISGKGDRSKEKEKGEEMIKDSEKKQQVFVGNQRGISASPPPPHQPRTTRELGT
ncbi:hypothetical protein BAE44_0014309, partial [Dichanthelium oligosanthes]